MYVTGEMIYACESGFLPSPLCVISLVGSVSAQIRLLKAEVKRASLLKQLHWRYEREPEEESMEAIGERLDFLTKDTLV